MHFSVECRLTQSPQRFEVGLTWISRASLSWRFFAGFGFLKFETAGEREPACRSWCMAA